MLKIVEVIGLRAALVDTIPPPTLRGARLRAFYLTPAFCAAVLSGVATATPVFDNTVLPGANVVGPGCCRVGDEVILAGTFRHVVNISLAVYTQNADWLTSIEMRIYANDGPGGAPGTVLWDSGTATFVVHAADTFIDFSVPGVLVPDTITVSSWISGQTGVGRFIPSGTTVGTFAAPWIEANYLPGDPWLASGFPFEVRVDAVDEPGTAALTMLAVTLLFGIRRPTVRGSAP